MDGNFGIKKIIFWYLKFNNLKNKFQRLHGITGFNGGMVYRHNFSLTLE